MSLGELRNEAGLPRPKEGEQSSPDPKARVVVAAVGVLPWREPENGACGKVGAKSCRWQKERPTHSQYEGESHDVDENKGYEKWNVGISHDVYETKRVILVIPRYIYIYENKQFI